MTRYYIIKNAIQTTEDKSPLYFKGFYTDSYWTEQIYNARMYSVIEELENTLIDESFSGGIYEIVTIYT